MAILGVDVGGTFTDAVLVEEGRIRTAKVPTAARQEESVTAAARAVGAGPHQPEVACHVVGDGDAEDSGGLRGSDAVRRVLEGDRLGRIDPERLERLEIQRR